MNWKPIPNTHGSYSASDTGEIRRDKPVRGNHKAGQIIRQGVDRYGYPQTSLSVNGKQRTVSVHRLVALAFLGDPGDASLQVNHKNGLKHDNRPENLEWCSVTHNIRHALATGLKTIKHGSDVGGSKLTEELAAKILSRIGKRGDQRILAREFGVSEGAISLLVNRKTWKHIR